MTAGDPARLRLHGTAVAIEGQGVLLRGASGAGKSDLAWRLIEVGAVLIADDLCEVRRQDDRLIIDLPAAVDSRFRGSIERRGLGIKTVPWFGPAPLILVADLADGRKDKPAGAGETLELLGLAVPLTVLDPFQPAAAAALSQMALRQLVD
jgi:serine kinase of HPr protein (carbohydrate metabolism regulator)